MPPRPPAPFAKEIATRAPAAGSAGRCSSAALSDSEPRFRDQLGRALYRADPADTREAAALIHAGTEKGFFRNYVASTSNAQMARLTVR